MYDDLIGVPFSNRGRGPSSYDCLGLVIEIYKRNGIFIPNWDVSVRSCNFIDGYIKTEVSSERWCKLIQPEYLCLITIQQHQEFVQHLAIYIDGGKFIHATPHKGVTVDCLNSPEYKNQIRGFYRYVS